MAGEINKVALGEKLYFFVSPAANNPACLILGHGGLLHGDGEFVLRQSLSMQFYVAHGEGRKIQIEGAVRGRNAGVNTKVELRSEGPCLLPNYTTRKALGSGASHAEPVSYADVENWMQMNSTSTNGWCPNVLSVRRRKIKGKTVQLSEMIDTVTGAYAHVVDFYYGCCREDISDDARASYIVRMKIKLLK